MSKSRGAVLEFGIRGSFHVDNLVIPSTKLAAKLANSIAMVLTEDNNNTDFHVTAQRPRVSLTTSKHFVSVTRLEYNSDRGPAAASLWKK